MGMIPRILVGAVGLTALVHGAAWACSCIEDGWGTADMVDEFDLVFWGEVLSVRNGFPGCPRGVMPDSVNVRIQVIDAFAGVETDEIVTLYTARSGASCGLDFQPGDSWLIFAAEDRQLSLCGASRQADEDDSTLVELRESAP